MVDDSQSCTVSKNLPLPSDNDRLTTATIAGCLLRTKGEMNNIWEHADTENLNLKNVPARSSFLEMVTLQRMVEPQDMDTISTFRPVVSDMASCGKS